MALKPDIVWVNEIQRAQIGQRIEPAERVGEGWRRAIAVAGLVRREHDIAAARKLNREGGLSLTGVDIAVRGEDRGGWILG